MPRHALPALLTLALAAPALGQPARLATLPLDSLARAYAAEHGLPSLVVGVTVDGERRVAGVGTADTLGTPARATTPYEIGSVSKVLTAVALADAVVRGEATLATPVAALLPDSVAVPAFEGAPIRLVDLATHTSGLPRLPLNMAVAPGFSLADPYATYGPDLLALFLRAQRLQAAPGSAYDYSNVGAGLLGYALAERAGVPYAVLVERRVLGPLGMSETFVDVPGPLRTRLATPHGADGAPVPPWTWTEPTVGAGGWRSSADDLLALVEAALAPGTTPLAGALELSLAPQVDLGDGRHVGLGWHLRPVPDRPDLVLAWHSGGTGGSSSFVGATLGAGVGVVALTNRQSDVEPLALEVLRRLVAVE